MKIKSESEVAQLCPTLRDPMDCSLPRPSVHGIFQARVLETYKYYLWQYQARHLYLELLCKSHLSYLFHKKVSNLPEAMFLLYGH